VDHARVAGEPPRGLSSHRRAMLETAAPRGAVSQGLGRHVHHDLMTLGPAASMAPCARKPSATNASASARRALNGTPAQWTFRPERRCAGAPPERHRSPSSRARLLRPANGRSVRANHRRRGEN
jgi:hypothetical protein